MADAGTDNRLGAIPRAIADNHHRIAIEEIALGKGVADALAEGVVVGTGHEPVSFALGHFGVHLLAPPRRALAGIRICQPYPS